MNIAKPSPTAPRASSVWLMRLRGLLAVPAAVVLVLCAPALAEAAFTANTAASMSVGTYKIPAPASINGTLRCVTSSGQKGASIRFTDFADVARATGYTATLTPPTGLKSVTSIPAGGTSQVYMVASGTTGKGSGTYIFTLTAQVGSWTGTSLTQTVTC